MLNTVEGITGKSNETAVIQSINDEIEESKMAAVESTIDAIVSKGNEEDIVEQVVATETKQMNNLLEKILNATENMF